MVDGPLRNKLRHLVAERVRFNCPLARFTSFGIGGPADALVEVHNEFELIELLGFFRAENVEWKVIGKGTNVLITDAGFSGAVILLEGSFREVKREKAKQRGDCCRVTAGAGCSLARMVSFCADEGLKGFEFACGIPGSLGGAIVMNAGAWGGEISDCLMSVTIADHTGIKRLDRHDLRFSYRSWHDYDDLAASSVIASAEVELAYGEVGEIKERCRNLLEKRNQRQPKGFANAGSFFKNPEGDYAGRLIEASGLKGVRIGGAMVSDVHANFLVNRGGATSKDIIELMELIQEKVFRDHKILLKPEIRFF